MNKEAKIKYLVNKGGYDISTVTALVSKNLEAKLSDLNKILASGWNRDLETKEKEDKKASQKAWIKHAYQGWK